MTGRGVLRWLLAALILIWGERAGAQSWERYRPGTLSAIVASENMVMSEIHDDTTKDGRAYNPGVPVRAELIFMGSTRGIDPQVKDFVAKWFRTRGEDPAEADIFAEEWLFSEAGKEYWIPVQIETAASMRGSVRAGDSVTAYSLCIGAWRVRGAAPWKWVFILSAAASD